MSPLKRLKRPWSKRSEDRSDEKPKTGSAYRKELIPAGRERLRGRCLAFSISQTAIQMAAADVRGAKTTLLEIRKTYLPTDQTGPVRTDAIIDDAIDDFVGEFGKRGCRVVVCLGGNETVFRTILMPALTKRELSSAVEYAVKERVPFPIENSIFDYRPVYRITDDEQSKQELSIIAATRTAVDGTVALFRKRHIPVQKVYLSHESIGELLSYLPDFNAGKGSTLINIGRSFCEIAFYRGATLEFFHVINTGTSFLGSGSGSAGMEFLAETLATEIQTSVDYYSGQYQTLSTNTIYVYGDLAYSRELIEMLNSNLGFEFHRFPVEKLSFFTKQKQSPDLVETAAVCLPVLASVVCQTRLANLLPGEDEQLLSERKANSIGRFSLLILTILLGAGWIFLRQDVGSSENVLQSLNRQIAQFEASDIYNHYTQLQNSIAVKRAYLEQTKQEPSYLALNLKELSLITPPEIRLSRFGFEADAAPENLHLTGSVLSNDIPPEVILAEFVEELNASPFYEQVTLKKHVKKLAKEGYEIEFQIGMRGIL